MKDVVKFLLFILCLIVLPYAQISYDISHLDTDISYENDAGGVFTTNLSFSNITVHETVFSHFEVTTNGGDLYAGSNFVINIRAVDSRGYHITITNITNLQVTALNQSLSVASTNMSVTNLTFVSPTSVTPDFTGISTNISYPIAGVIYVDFNGTTNTNLLGPLTIRSIIQQIFVANPVYQPWQSYTNIIIYGIDVSGATNDISYMYHFDATSDPYISVDDTNRIYTVDVGPGVLYASNKYDNSFTTNITILVTLLPADVSVISRSNIDISIGSGTFNEEVYLDARAPENPISLVYPLDSLIPDVLADIADAEINLDSAVSGRLVFTNRDIQLTAIATNGSRLTGQFNQSIDITFPYTDADLQLANGNKLSENMLSVVMLSNDGGIFRWIEISNCIVDVNNHTVTVSVSQDGVYSLASRINVMADDLENVEIFPNPADLTINGSITIFNLPLDTVEVQIYKVDGRKIKTLKDVMELNINGAAVNGSVWDGLDENGEKASAGLYFINVVSESSSKILKLIIQNEY